MTVDRKTANGGALTPKSFSSLIAVMGGVIASAIVLVCGFSVGRLFSEWRRPDNLSVARELAQDKSIDSIKSSVAAYRRYLLESPRDNAVRIELALLLSTGDPDAALREFRRIPPETLEHATAARYVATLSLTLERDDDAIGPLEFLETKYPRDAGVRQALAEIYFRKREFEKSLDYARRLRTLNPASIDACLLIAECSDSLGRAADMIEPLESALGLDAELPQAHLNLAYAYDAAGRPEDAMPHIQWFLERYPKSVSAHRLLATVERSRGHYDEALAAATAGLTLVPRNLEFSILAAEVLLYLRRPAEAFERLDGLVNDRPKERRLLAPLIRAAVLCGKSERAQELQTLLQRIDSRE